MPPQPSPLPENPSLENLKRRAKQLVRSVRAGEADALERVRAWHPRGAAAAAAFTLSDAQLVAARAYGFASWPKLKKHLETVERFTWDPPGDPLVGEARARDGARPVAPGGSAATGGTRADASEATFVRLACMDYADWRPSWAAKARRMLAANPALARAGMAAAAVAGDHAAVREMLAADPALANAKCAPHDWEPLLYACYSRLDSPDPAHSTLEVARLLLEAGADPNAGFLWRGLPTPFTALTGAFGEGERGNNHPPHRHRDALARLLLDAGADPNDGQTLYNRHFRPDDGHLKLLFAHGLGRSATGPWFRRLAGRIQSPGQMLVEELWAAAGKNYVDRVRLLVENGADVNGKGFRDGRTPYETAVLAGNEEIASHLLANGARATTLSPVERFGAACAGGRRAEARALLAADPTLLDQLGSAGRIALLHRAVESSRPEAIRLMAELGFDLSGLGRNTPMHQAAWSGDLPMVKLLVELGADPTVREPAYDATPLGWAAYNQQQPVVDYLLRLASISDAIGCGAVERASELLRADPGLARRGDERGVPLVFDLHEGTPRLAEMVALLREHGADLEARDGNGRTAVEAARQRGANEFAQSLAASVGDTTG